MKTKVVILGVLVTLIYCFTCPSLENMAFGQSVKTISTPEEFFGFMPGNDGMLFDYETLIKYLQKLDTESPRLKMVEIGFSPMGRRIYIAFVSSEENINQLDQLKQINKRLDLLSLHQSSHMILSQQKIYIK
jgi:hypothetical protein